MRLKLVRCVTAPQHARRVLPRQVNVTCVTGALTTLGGVGNSINIVRQLSVKRPPPPAVETVAVAVAEFVFRFYLAGRVGRAGSGTHLEMLARLVRIAPAVGVPVITESSYGQSNVCCRARGQAGQWCS